MAAESHLTLATKEHSYYKKQCSECKTSLRAMFTDNEVFKPPPTLLCNQGASQSPSTLLLTLHSRYSIYTLHEEKGNDENPRICMYIEYSGALPKRSTTAWPSIFPDTKEMRNIWSLLCRCECALRNAYMYIPSIKRTKYYTLYNVNYLIDEALQTGKGANTVISMLHHFLQTHAFGEEHLKLHTGNCSGQNENRWMNVHVGCMV